MSIFDIDDTRIYTMSDDELDREARRLVTEASKTGDWRGIIDELEFIKTRLDR